MVSIAVLGAGAWGTALACAFARRPGEAPVRLWGRDPAALSAIRAAGENASMLPGVPLPAGLRVEADLGTALADAAIVVVAVPAQAVRALLADPASSIAPGVPLVVTAKGIERGTGLFLTEVAAACRPGNPAAILSGPSFAADVGRGRPTAVTVAAADANRAEALARSLGAPGLRLYHSDDVRGVEIGGAAKNVLAIACGIAQGRALGASAGAALVARAFAELSRFGRAFGARPDTLSGLSGLGDLVLTCGSSQSRNFAFGEALGRGGAVEAGRGGPVVEGVWTAEILVELARARGIEMPICEGVAAVLAGRRTVGEAIEALMNRPLKAE